MALHLMGQSPTHRAITTAAQGPFSKKPGAVARMGRKEKIAAALTIWELLAYWQKMISRLRGYSMKRALALGREMGDKWGILRRR